ncbi:MAG TPA: polysaccharide deacetylase family protein [Burkholderiales bacterium]|nr:polysaccharide deacetylase family protein [Burkholderiales bacterium]
MRFPNRNVSFPDDPDAAIQAGSASRQAIAEMLCTRIERLPNLEARFSEVKRLSGLFAFDLEAALADRRFDLMTEDEIRAAAQAGFDVQLHTHTHRMHGFDADRVMEEVERNRAALARILNAPAERFQHFCYPSGEHDESIFGVLQQIGVQSATTTEPGLNNQSTNPMALRRIVDCESTSDVEFEARLSGFWSLIYQLRRFCKRRRTVEMADTPA